MAEGGALQARRLRGQGLGLQLKGVTKGACAQAVQGLDPDPGGEGERDESDFSRFIVVWFMKGCKHCENCSASLS